MDPGITWARMCEIADNLATLGDIDDLPLGSRQHALAMMDELGKLTRGLHDWFTRGGYPPDGWPANHVDIRRQNVTPLAAQHVLGYFEPDGPAGLQAGGFVTALVDAISKADIPNMRKLALSFPVLVSAVNVYQNELDGRAWLRAKAVQHG